MFLTTYRGNSGTAPLILIFSIRWTRIVNYTTRTALPPVYIKYEAGWVSEMVPRFGREKNLLSLPGYDPRTVQLVTQSLYRLSYTGQQFHTCRYVRKILKLILWKQGWTTWTGWIWFRKGTGGSIVKMVALLHGVI